MSDAFEVCSTCDQGGSACLTCGDVPHSFDVLLTNALSKLEISEIMPVSDMDVESSYYTRQQAMEFALVYVANTIAATSPTQLFALSIAIEDWLVNGDDSLVVAAIANENGGVID